MYTKLHKSESKRALSERGAMRLLWAAALLLPLVPTSGAKRLARSSELRNGTAAVNATSTGNSTSAATNRTGYFYDSCKRACDLCFAEHLQSCSATCYKGKQAYCKEQCVADCVPMWTAMPSTYGADGVSRKFCDGHTDLDGCPTQPYTYDD